MKYLKTNDVPVWGQVTIINVVTKKILYSYDGEGKMEFPQEVANLDVIALYSSNDKTIIEVV